jgi:cytoskeletal protein RodZ
MQQTIGSWLRSAREQQGISLGEISQATKMNLLSLEALEDDRFDQLPGGMFPCAMVRSYARAAGASEQGALDVYKSQFPPPPPPAPEPRRNWIPLLRITASLILCLACGAVAFGYLGNEWMARPLPQSPEEPAISPLPQLPEEPAIHPLPIDSSLVAALGVQEPTFVSVGSPPGLDLQILVLDECWLSLSADGSVVDRRLLKKGEAFSYHADNSFEAVVGNAGGLRLVINGKVWENLGNPYDVKKIRIEKGDGKVRLTT